MKPLKRILSALLVTVLLCGLLPAAAGVDNENILSALSITSAGITQTYPISTSSRDIYVTYPNNAASLDLTNGLDPVFDTSRYKAVVLSPSIAAAEDGDIVSLAVTYNYFSDIDGAAQSTTVYSVHVSQAAASVPTFSGALVKEFSPTYPSTQTIAYGELAAFYKPNDGDDFGALAIFGVNPTFGAIKVNGTDYTFGDAIYPGSTLTFIATAGGSVSYNVKAYSNVDPTQPIGNVVLTVTLSAPPTIKSDLNKTVTKGSYLFSVKDFADNCNLYGVPIDSVKITPTASTAGTWYNGTKAFSTVTTFTAAELSNLSFVGNASGTATFTWSVTTKGGTTGNGNGTFTVTSPTLVLTPYSDITQKFRGSTWPVSTSYFSYTPAQIALSYIKITSIPATTDGYLSLSTALPKNDTYGYTAIAANVPLTANAIIPAAYINYLGITTKTTSTKTAVSFNWTATTDMKISTATWGVPVSYTVGFISGTPLSCSTDMNIPAALVTAGVTTQFSSLGLALSYMTFTVPDKNLGSLYANYNISTKTGTAVAAATKYYAGKSPNLANLTFVPAADFYGQGSITYNAYSNTGVLFTGTITFIVNSNPGGTVSYTTDKNSPIQLDSKDFQAAFSSATGKSLAYVYFSLPSTSYGTLYYNYTLSGDYDSAVSSSYPYYILRSQYLSLVSFVPYNDFKGSLRIGYTAYADGISYTGMLVINVVDSPGGTVKYSVRQNGSVALTAGDFSSEFIGVTGSLLSYVTFTPPAATTGSMYTQYDATKLTGTKLTASIKYYDGKSPDLSDITFVPVKDFIGTCSVPYTAYSVNGVAYTGKLIFTVYEGSDVITYRTESGIPVHMNSSDFSNAFYIYNGGKSLSYMTFEIPSTSYGSLYYNYTSPTQYDSVVSSDKKYGVSTSPYISTVAFVPRDTYTGSFSISYTGYTASGESYTGKIKIIVSSANNGSVNYTTSAATPVSFSASDFITAFYGKSVNPLNYVRFTLPYASYGTLYSGYTPTSSYNTLVSSASNYYVSSLSAITFVPNLNYSGALAINYIAYDTAGYPYNGTVYITVKSNDIGTMTYGTNMNTPFVFNADSLNTAFLNKTGSALYSMSFTLPSSSYGTLYLGNNTTTPSAVYAGTRYYKSFSPLLSAISFVPAAGYYGTVTIPYTAYTASGSAYNGKIVMNVGTAVPFTDINENYPWASDAITYLYRNNIITDTGSGKYNPGIDMTRGDFIMMIANAFDLTDPGYDDFPDVSPESTYYDAISAAKAVGIIFGSPDGNFYPETGLTRQDAMVIIVRALEYVGAPISEGSTNDLISYADATQVSDYAVTAVATLVKTGLVAGNAGNLSPKSMISRAETAVILYRIITM